MNTELDAEPSLGDLLRIYRRRRGVVYTVLAVVLIVTALYCIFGTRRYEAISSLQVQKEGVDDAMGLEDLMSSATGAGDDPLSANIEIETQATILASDTLALQTIEHLKMEDTEDYRPRWNPIEWFLDLISPAGGADPSGVSLENAPKRRRKVLDTFEKHLDIKPIDGTRVIEIDFTNPDPKLASAVVNDLMNNLADYGFKTRYDATSQASKWLEYQLGDLRKDSQDLQTKVENLQRESGVYSLGTVDATGREQAYSTVLDRLQQSTAALAVAVQNRILRGAIAKAAESGNAELLSGLAGNTLGGTSPTVSSALVLVQGLRQQEATELAAIKEAESKFGPSYPKLAEMRENLAGIDRSIADEVGRLKSRAETDFEVAQQTEDNVRKDRDEAKKAADLLNDKAIQYIILKEDAVESRGLYEDLLKRLKEAGVIQGLKSSNITIVDPGRVPGKPKTPNVPLFMGIALLGGWVLGCVGAFLSHTLDNRIDTVHDLEDLTKQTPLGVLPELPVGQTGKGKGILALTDPGSIFVESMRSIRTALLLSQTDSPPKVILVTSAIAGEGKSFCALNLAGLLAQGGRRTLLIDTDLRRGTVNKRLDIQTRQGLSELLAGQYTTPPIQPVPGVENLDVLIAGRRPPNPTDLLESEAMKKWLSKFREDYDFVVLDSAPILPVTDTVALNSQVDVTILIVRSRVTERAQVLRSYGLLNRDDRHYVGIVLNGLNIKDSSYYGYHGYRQYTSPYAEGKDGSKE